jgi:hypothetical protein
MDISFRLVLLSNRTKANVQFRLNLYSSTREDEYLEILTHVRAVDLYNDAVDKLEAWCMCQSEHEQLLGATELIRSGNSNIAKLARTKGVARQAVDQFKSILRNLVREELLIEPGQNEQSIIGREIVLLLDAISKTDRKVARHGEC